MHEERVFTSPPLQKGSRLHYLSSSIAGHGLQVAYSLRIWTSLHNVAHELSVWQMWPRFLVWTYWQRKVTWKCYKKQIDLLHLIVHYLCLHKGHWQIHVCSVKDWNCVHHHRTNLGSKRHPPVMLTRDEGDFAAKFISFGLVQPACQQELPLNLHTVRCILYDLLCMTFRVWSLSRHCTCTCARNIVKPG